MRQQPWCRQPAGGIVSRCGQRCACRCDFRHIPHQLVSVAAGGSHDERHTVASIQLQGTAKDVSSRLRVDSENRQRQHMPLRSHEQRLGGCSQPRRGSAPRATTMQSVRCPASPGCTGGTHRVALFQLVQHGGAVRLQLNVHARTGDVLPGTGCCAQGKAGSAQSQRRSVKGRELAQRRTTEGHRQEVEAALDDRLGGGKAHLASDAIHHDHWQPLCASRHGAHALSSQRTSGRHRQPWPGGSACDSLPVGCSGSAPSQLRRRRHHLPEHLAQF